MIEFRINLNNNIFYSYDNMPTVRKMKNIYLLSGNFKLTLSWVKTNLSWRSLAMSSDPVRNEDSRFEERLEEDWTVEEDDMDTFLVELKEEVEEEENEVFFDSWTEDEEDPLGTTEDVEELLSWTELDEVEELWTGPEGAAPSSYDRNSF